MKGNPIIQINSIYSSLYPKEKVIADVILKEPERILHYSIVELSELAGVSYSSIVRFCQRIGYTGYSDFKMSMAMSSRDFSSSLHYELPESAGSLRSAVTNIFQTQAAFLTRLPDYIRYEQLEKAVDAMNKARNVYICGNVYSGLVAAGFQVRLKSLGIPCFLSHNHTEMKQDSLSIGDQDVVFAISQSGMSRDTISMIMTARERHATTIGLTASDKSPLLQYLDIPMILPMLSTHLIENYYGIEVAAHLMLNCMVILLDAKRNEDHKAQYEKYFSELIRESVLEEN